MPPDQAARILIVDDDEHIARLIGFVLNSRGCLCTTAYSGAQALGKFRNDDFNLVITDLGMPWGDGITFIQTVRRSSDLPIIVISALAAEYELQLRLLNDIVVLPKPLNLEKLVKHVRDGCGPLQNPPASSGTLPTPSPILQPEAPMDRPAILIADDDIGMVRLLRTVLEPLGAEIRTTHDAVSALTKIHESPPDLVILDVNMPSGNGLSVCEMLATDTGLARLPVIMLTGEAEHARVRCVAMGAHYIQKGTEAMVQLKQLAAQILADAKNEASKSQLFIG